MWQTFGHEKAIRTLGRSMEAGRVAHSYLITGPTKIGKTTLALDIARAAPVAAAAARKAARRASGTGTR